MKQIKKKLIQIILLNLQIKKNFLKLKQMLQIVNGPENGIKLLL
jgi:hypothetical protein